MTDHECDNPCCDEDPGPDPALCQWCGRLIEQCTCGDELDPTDTDREPPDLMQRAFEEDR